MEKEKFSILVSSPLDSGYVQNLSFQAGYHWVNMHQKPKYTNSDQLFFYPNKKMAQGSSDNDSYLDTKTDYSFPKDAVKIHELFNTPEYKVGDYVVNLILKFILILELKILKILMLVKKYLVILENYEK